MKVRGNRVELGEIEAVLLTHPLVGAAAVTTHEPEHGSLQLAAHVTAAGPSSASAAELRAFLRAKVPGYMVPSAFVAHEELPLTSSGKTDPARAW